MTGAKIRPVLQAAHIRPLPAGGEHRADNGLLLRSEVYTLYDRSYLAVGPRHASSSAPSPEPIHSLTGLRLLQSLMVERR